MSTTDRTAGAGGGRGNGSVIDRRINYPTPMSSNQNAALSLAEREERANELDKLLRAALVATARRLLVLVPPARRSVADTNFLQDVARNRRAPSDLTLLHLLEIEKNAEAAERFTLSEAIRAVEVASAPLGVPCRTEATDAETQANHSLDDAQLLAEREDTPTRWQQVREFGQRQLEATRRLIDAANAHLSRRTA